MSRRRDSIKSTTNISTKQEQATSLRRSQRLIDRNVQDQLAKTPNPAKTRAPKASQQEGKSVEKLSFCAIPTSGRRRSPRLSNRVDENPNIRKSLRLSLIRNSNEKKRSESSLNKETGVCSNDKIKRRSERKIKNCMNCSVVIGLQAAKEKNCKEKYQEIRVSKNVCQKREEFRVSKKRKRGEECDNVNAKGWTKEQEMALQRAYLLAKPTPNFWKKVSKLVPGKSAQDCFDRVHSDHITPPQPLPRSRVGRVKSSPLAHFSLSAGKLLSPSRLMVKQLNGNKLKGRTTQKMVRQLLQKHNRADQTCDADLFFLLEPNVNLSREDSQLMDIISTPECVEEKKGVLRKCHERSLCGQKKPFSRLENLRGMTLASPPVLKQIKNRALHEKYIDLLHFRDAKRKKMCARALKENSTPINIQKRDVIRAAKNALVSDARDAIDKLQQLRTNDNKDSSDIDNDDCDSDDDCDIPDSN